MRGDGSRIEAKLNLCKYILHMIVKPGLFGENIHSHLLWHIEFLLSICYNYN